MTVEYFEARPWLEAGDVLGESPRYDARTKSVSWIDIDSGVRRTAELDGPIGRVEDFGVPLGAHEFGREADAIAVGSVWWEVDRATGARRRLARVDAAGMRFNDSAIDSRGRLWSATMREDELMVGAPMGCLHMLEGECLESRLDGLTAGNGIAWSPNDRFMYLVNSGPDHVLRMPFDAESGTIGAPEVWVEPDSGAVDGIATDLAGGLWLALWGIGELHRFDRNGRHVAVVRVAATQVTAACFAGPDLQTLVITTSGRESDDTEEFGGSVFRVDVPIPGRPATLWRGY